MKADLTTRADIQTLVNTFYDKALVDESIGHFFTEAAKHDWPSHLETMYDFWDNAIFYSGKYTGNPILVHERIHHAIPFSHQHFQRWTQLFVTTVDELFAGPNAELAKQRAISIATVMEIKVFKV